MNCDHNRDVFVHCEGSVLTFLQLFYLLSFIPALCEEDLVVDAAYGSYNWTVAKAETKSFIACQFGAVNENSALPVVAIRHCDLRGNWLETNFSECATFSKSTLRNILSVRTKHKLFCQLLLNRDSSLQLSLNTSNVANITEGVLDAIVQASIDEDQTESNLNQIVDVYKRFEMNCTTENQVCTCV